MSDNTYISIEQKQEAIYNVFHRDADTGTAIENLGVEHTLEDAVQTANEFDYGVEYGLHIKLLKPNGK